LSGCGSTITTRIQSGRIARSAAALSRAQINRDVREMERTCRHAD
jgi:hypothetical protein